jgi:hypothetical protein
VVSFDPRILLQLQATHRVHPNSKAFTMFLQLVTPPNPLSPGSPYPIRAPFTHQTRHAVESLFCYHPLQISAIVETFWRNRFNSKSSPFAAWPASITEPLMQGPTPLLEGFISGYDWTTSPAAPSPLLPPYHPNFVYPAQQPGLQITPNSSGNRQWPASNWDHLIYAYLVENTRIYDIFNKVLETYMFSELLETPSATSQLFWRNVESLIYGDAVPTMVWTTTGRNRRDEMANRMTVYYWMFGIDLSHAQDLATQHPYVKPAASNHEFIPTFETFAREVWRGIVNVKNLTGPNDTDNEAIATAARRIYDMMLTRRLNGNLSREEFRAVALMSFLHLSIMYNSPVVLDLKAKASAPEQRLFKIAERVGMTAHANSKPLFDLSQPFSLLLQLIETGNFNLPSNAPILYTVPNPIANMAEIVIDQYCLATGRDLKSQAVSVSPRATSPSALTPSRTAPRVTNGRSAKVPAGH